MGRKSRATAASRRRERALKERRQQKLRRRAERREEKADQPRVDDLEGIVPGPQEIPWEDFGLPPLEEDEDDKDQVASA